MELFNCHEVENTVIDNRAKRNTAERLMHGKKSISRTIDPMEISLGRMRWKRDGNCSPLKPQN